LIYSGPVLFSLLFYYIAHLLPRMLSSAKLDSAGLMESKIRAPWHSA